MTEADIGLGSTGFARAMDGLNLEGATLLGGGPRLIDYGTDLPAASMPSSRSVRARSPKNGWGETAEAGHETAGGNRRNPLSELDVCGASTEHELGGILFVI